MFRNVTQYIDLPQAAFWVFFLLFVGMCLYLRRNDKREGYPMYASPFTPQRLLGFPLPPPPHTYLLNEGGTTDTPHLYEQAGPRGTPFRKFDGTPYTPSGNPLTACLGPGAWVMRRDEPMQTEKHEPVLKPLRELEDWWIDEDETDPRGMTVFDWRWHPVGRVHDIWVDRAIRIMRLLEVELHDGSRVLVPIYHTNINERTREIHVTSLHAHQFHGIPMPARDNLITAREDERLNAYFAAGRFYRASDLTDPQLGARG